MKRRASVSGRLAADLVDGAPTRWRRLRDRADMRRTGGGAGRRRACAFAAARGRSQTAGARTTRRTPRPWDEDFHEPEILSALPGYLL
jgi:hypothetical protein